MEQTMKFKMAIAILLLLLAWVICLTLWIRNHGFSAKENPSRMEKFLARHARRLATPAWAKGLKNPYPVTAASIAEAREHFVAHCSICHGLDGRGNTTIGRNLYPKAPDMTDAETQQLTDGELYYIISNGVRFTGMPAWGSDDDPESIWGLVAFIRRLPRLSPAELQLMQELAGGSGAKKDEATAKPHTPEAKPHKH